MSYFSRLFRNLTGEPPVSQSATNLQAALQRLSTCLSAAEAANPSDGSTDATMDAFTSQVSEATNRVNALTAKLGGDVPAA